jgi:hypothetical protein
MSKASLRNGFEIQESVRAPSIPETSVNFYQTVCRYKPEESHLHVKFKIFTAVTILMTFFRAEDGDSTLLRNVGCYRPVPMAT